MPESGPLINPLFRLAALFAALFVVTIFALVAVMFGDQSAPPVRFLNTHGSTLILCEVAGILVFGLLAMIVDRVQFLRRNFRDEPAAPPSGPKAG